MQITPRSSSVLPPPPSRTRQVFEGALDGFVGTALPSFAGAYTPGGLGTLAGAAVGALSCAATGEVDRKQLLLSAANGALCGVVGAYFGPGGAAVLTGLGAVIGAALPFFPEP